MADWDLAAAKWARRFSLGADAQEAFAQERVEWVQSLYGACGLTVDQSQWLPQQARCVLDAFRRRARQYLVRLSGDALAETQLSPEERAEIQTALIHRGFMDGEADGEFGPITRSAIRKFQETFGYPPRDFLSKEQRAALLTPTFNGARPTAPMGGPFVPVPPGTKFEPAVATPPPPTPDTQSTRITVLLQKRGGVYAVPVRINDAITLNFVVDSGAADVSIPADVVLTLMRSGTIVGTDFLGEKTYVLADGTKVPSKVFRIRSLRVGNKIVENVIGSVASVRGDLLLGQSFLSRFKSWSIDNNTNSLVLDSGQ